MFSYHGWIVIEHALYHQQWINRDIDYVEYRRLLLEITAELVSIAEKQFDLAEKDLSVMDGSDGMITVHVSGRRNHFNFGMEDLLKWLAEKAPMSFGLIYYINGENDDYEYSYRVLRLAKNQVTELDDIYLSPIDTMIE